MKVSCWRVSYRQHFKKLYLNASAVLQEEAVLEKIQETLTPEEYHLLKRLVFDRASHLDATRELGISVYASRKRLARIRDKLYIVFPDRRRPGKEGKNFVRPCQERPCTVILKRKGGLPWRKAGRNTPI